MVHSGMALSQLVSIRPFLGRMTNQRIEKKKVLDIFNCMQKLKRADHTDLAI